VIQNDFFALGQIRPFALKWATNVVIPTRSNKVKRELDSALSDELNQIIDIV